VSVELVGERDSGGITPAAAASIGMAAMTRQATPTDVPVGIADDGGAATGVPPMGAGSEPPGARLARLAAEDAAGDEQQRQHTARYPAGCGRCGACAAASRYGLTVGSLIVLTSAHPWSGQGQRGMERVTMRCRIAHVRSDRFDYVAVELLDVVDPLPGGPYDREARDVTGNKGGMTWTHAFEQLNNDTLRIER